MIHYDTSTVRMPNRSQTITFSTNIVSLEDTSASVYRQASMTGLNTEPITAVSIVDNPRHV